MTHLHFVRNLKSTTIRTYLSALSFVHKCRELRDPTTTFLVKKAVEGVKNSTPAATGSPLLPITRQLLQKITQVIKFCTASPYDQALYKAIYLLAYHACMRAGEITASTNRQHIIQLAQVNISETHAYIHFESYKHSASHKPVIKLTSTHPNTFCPVTALRQYLPLRGTFPGALFVDVHRKPISRRAFACMLKSCLQQAGIPSDNYNCHSFRIGRATQLAHDNCPPADIQRVGRWKSNAFQKYIRPSHISMPN